MLALLSSGRIPAAISPGGIKLENFGNNGNNTPDKVVKRFLSSAGLRDQESLTLTITACYLGRVNEPEVLAQASLVGQSSFLKHPFVSGRLGPMLT